MSTSGTPRAGDGTPSPAPPTRLTVVTPGRRAISAEPPSRRSIRTPGSLGRSAQRPGLSASGRKAGAGAVTPHGRAAIRTLDSRRAAIFTPGRRRSQREQQRPTPRDDLRALSRLVAGTSRAIPSSSSSPGVHAKSESLGSAILEEIEEDDDDERPLRVPRLSVPLDADDEGEGDIWPHRSAGLEDAENFTMQSVEMPRRAVSENPLDRLSVARASDLFRREALRTSEVGVDSAFFPPRHAIDEDGIAMAAREDTTFERLEVANERQIGRESDFGIVVDANESTFMIAPPIDGSPQQPLDAIEDSHIQFDDDPGQGRFEDMAEDDDDNDDIEAAASATFQTGVGARKDTARRAKKAKAGVKMSQYGIEYPSLPAGIVKRLAQTFAQTSGAKAKISPDTLAAVMRASDWFFEQLGDDLKAYAQHAGRKTIDESDVLAVMKRQRQISSAATPFSLAQRYLPRELLQELRMPPPLVVKKGRRAKVPSKDRG